MYAVCKPAADNGGNSGFVQLMSGGKQMSKPLGAGTIDVVYNETYDEFGLSRHFHNSYEIILILEGKVRYTINNSRYIAGKNSVVLISNLEMHEIEILEYPYKRYYALINPDYFQSIISDPILISIFKHRPDHFKHVIHLEDKESLYFGKLLKTMYDEVSSRQDMWQSVLGSYIHLFIVSLYRSHKSSFPMTIFNSSMNTVIEIQKYIEEHYMEDITLNTISKLFYTDMYYISHLFKKVTGYNFKEYLIRCRLSKAKELLFYTNANITQVGLDSGFTNVNHFIRIFKKYEFTTPHQYRMKYR